MVCLYPSSACSRLYSRWNPTRFVKNIKREDIKTSTLRNIIYFGRGSLLFLISSQVQVQFDVLLEKLRLFMYTLRSHLICKMNNKKTFHLMQCVFLNVGTYGLSLLL